MASKRHRRPASVGNIYANLFSILLVFYAVFACQQAGATGVNATLICLLTYAVALIVMEVLVLRTPFKPETGLKFGSFKPSFSRVIFKLVGLYSSYGALVILYWLFPEYHSSLSLDVENSRFYTPYALMLYRVLPTLLILAIPYTVFLDGVMAEPEDRYYQIGRYLLFRKDARLSIRIVSQHYLSWVVRGYFLALLSVYVNTSVTSMVTEDYSTVFDSLDRFYRFFFNVVLFLGLVISVVGHSLALRVINTHIRSVEPTLFGWWICLFFFQPFKSINDLYVMPLGTDDAWLFALQDMPFFAYIWAGVIMLFMVLTVFSDIQFGARYSYLTHRGIITDGLYKYTKHPSYITVCLIYVMTYFPFFAFDDYEMIASGFLALALLSLVYFLRARTEENHLSHDPVYVEYGLWMNEHGIFRSLTKWLPFIAYTPPKHAKALQTSSYVGIE